VPVGGHADWAQVSSGEDHSCAVRVNGTAWCWGHGWFGVLGSGSLDDELVPTQVQTP
jgi:alpha-tubulin suppressor-like RCC1 family protein